MFSFILELLILIIEETTIAHAHTHTLLTHLTHVHRRKGKPYVVFLLLLTCGCMRFIYQIKNLLVILLYISSYDILYFGFVVLEPPR